MSKVMLFTVGGKEKYIEILKEQFRKAAMNNEYELMYNTQEKIREIMTNREFRDWCIEDEYDDNGNKICLESWNGRR